jgi:hypothetical protein
MKKTMPLLESCLTLLENRFDRPVSLKFVVYDEETRERIFNFSTDFDPSEKNRFKSRNSLLRGVQNVVLSTHHHVALCSVFDFVKMDSFGSFVFVDCDKPLLWSTRRS